MMLAPVAAMLLAAGRGERMRPLTDSCPKPLLKVRGKPLMQWHLEALARGGFNHVVVNTAWLGEQIERSISSSLQIQYSHEGRDFGGALETAGGIVRALPLLCPTEHTDAGADVFWVLAADVFVPGFKFTQAAVDRFKCSGKLAHLWLVSNPAHNVAGDFGLGLNAGAVPGELSRVGLALNLPPADARPRYTYSTIGLYRKALLEPPWCSIPSGNPQGMKAPLAPLLRAAMDNALVTAELYDGAWTDVGTPERLEVLNALK